MSIARQYIKPGCLIVDATCGNGHDTLALAKAAFRTNESAADSFCSSCCMANDDLAAGILAAGILAIDIQEMAIENTRKLLIENGFSDLISDGSIVLKQGSHENLKAMVWDLESFREHAGDAAGCADGTVSHAGDAVPDVCLVMFNLGYLPGGNKIVTTTTGPTIEAVKSAIDLIMKGGLVCVTMYSGHEEGKKEKQALLAFAEELDSRKYHVAYISMTNQKNDPPEILLITRKS